jgi:predicted NBD/HSP70 family sugar kinase
MYYLGLDIGGTKIAAVVMDAQGRKKALPLPDAKSELSAVCGIGGRLY